ncbi:MAG: hypothetical protein QOK27_646 [Gemmatimonadales bacterium]|nr:hypothetical protein [Gemmatimonadales bacterium]
MPLLREVHFDRSHAHVKPTCRPARRDAARHRRSGGVNPIPVAIEHTEDSLDRGNCSTHSDDDLVG